MGLKPIIFGNARGILFNKMLIHFCELRKMKIMKPKMQLSALLTVLMLAQSTLAMIPEFPEAKIQVLAESTRSAQEQTDETLILRDASFETPAVKYSVTASSTASVQESGPEILIQ